MWIKVQSGKTFKCGLKVIKNITGCLVKHRMISSSDTFR